MDDDEFDDWELDDWELEAADDADLDDPEVDEAEEETGFFDLDQDEDGDTEDDEGGGFSFALTDGLEDDEADGHGGGAGTGAKPEALTDDRGERMGWSAWDVGTVFAMGGWMADRHADRMVEQISRALAGHRISRPAGATAVGAPPPPPPSGYPYGIARGSLAVGDLVDQGRLYEELDSANEMGRDLLIQAEGPGGSDGPLVLVISAVPLSEGPRLWVVAEELTGGFSATRLVPVFLPQRNGGFGVFASDDPTEAVDAAAWACQREGVSLARLTVTRRR